MSIAFDRSRLRDIDLWDPVIKSHPGPTFTKLADAKPFYVEIADAPQAVMARYPDARRALEDHALFSNVKRPWPGTEKFYYWQGLPVVTDNDPPTHTKLRRLLSPAFSPRRLASVEAGVRAFVHERIDALEVQHGFDLMQDFGRRLSVHMLLGLLMDIPEEDRALFVAVSDGLNLFAHMKPGETAPAAYLEAWKAARAYCDALIERRRKDPRDDLVSNIIAAHDVDGRLTADELFATFVILYIAGLSGVAHLIGWLIWRLCRAPDQMALLRAQPELINNAIEECLRIEPIGYAALRYATQDFEFEGLSLLENMPIIVLEGVSNFDPARYEDPLRFDITREPKRDFLSFGWGVHHCIGAPVARMAARIAITDLLARFPKLRLADKGFIPSVVGGPKDRGPASMPLAID